MRFVDPHVGFTLPAEVGMRRLDDRTGSRRKGLRNLISSEGRQRRPKDGDEICGSDEQIHQGICFLRQGRWFQKPSPIRWVGLSRDGRFAEIAEECELGGGALGDAAFQSLRDGLP